MTTTTTTIEGETSPAPVVAAVDSPGIEALAAVAESAIEATAERVEELALARAQLETLGSDIAELRVTLSAHIESNQAAFAGLHEMIGRQQAAIDVLHDTVEEEIEIEDEEAEAEVEIPAEVADVSAALAEEPTPPQHHDEAPHDTPSDRPRGRHFVKI
jgi:hypothetical protein